MRQRIALVLSVIALAMVALAIPSHIHPTTNPGSNPGSGSALTVELYVYKNGELVYYDPDDPAVINLAYLLAEFLDNDNGALESGVGTRLDGVQSWNSGSTPIVRQYSGYGNVYGTQGAIILGNSTSFGRYDYGFTTVYAIVHIDEFNITVSNDNIKIIVGGSYTLPTTSSPINITSVGLGITSVGPSQPPIVEKTWLLFKDVLSTPVAISPGDTIHVRYVISLP